MCISSFIHFHHFLLPFSTTSAAKTVELKPNDAVYVKMGKKVYVEQCASCHGINLEGQDGWRNTKVDGMRLAPPHDKSGHTWHHADEVLFNLTKYGFKAMISEDYEVNMPVYNGIIKDHEIVAVLSSSLHGQLTSKKSMTKSTLITKSNRAMKKKMGGS